MNLSERTDYRPKVMTYDIQKLITRAKNHGGHAQVGAMASVFSKTCLRPGHVKKKHNENSIKKKFHHLGGSFRQGSFSVTLNTVFVYRALDVPPKTLGAGDS